MWQKLGRFFSNSAICWQAAHRSLSCFSSRQCLFSLIFFFCFDEDCSFLSAGPPKCDVSPKPSFPQRHFLLQTHRTWTEHLTHTLTEGMQSLPPVHLLIDKINRLSKQGAMSLQNYGKWTVFHTTNDSHVQSTDWSIRSALRAMLISTVIQQIAAFVHHVLFSWKQILMGRPVLPMRILSFLHFFPFWTQPKVCTTRKVKPAAAPSKLQIWTLNWTQDR